MKTPVLKQNHHESLTLNVTIKYAHVLSETTTRAVKYQETRCAAQTSHFCPYLRLLVASMVWVSPQARKLEFLLADAKKQEADCVVTIGGVQSNHCRATAVAARMMGLESHLILRYGFHVYVR